jgi:hypothetical protein
MKFLVFCRNAKFMSVFKSARRWLLSLATWVQRIFFSSWSILILSTYLRQSIAQDVPSRHLLESKLCRHILVYTNFIWRGVSFMNPLIMRYFNLSLFSSPWRPYTRLTPRSHMPSDDETFFWSTHTFCYMPYTEKWIKRLSRLWHHIFSYMLYLRLVIRNVTEPVTCFGNAFF